MIKRNTMYNKLLYFYLVWFIVIALVMIPVGIYFRKFLHVGLGIHQVFVLWVIVGLTQVLSMGGVLYITRSVLRPIKQLVAYCREIGNGRYQTCLSGMDYQSDEVGELAETLITTTNNLTEKLFELNIVNQHLEENMSMLKAIFEVDRAINSLYVNELNETITYAIVNNVKGTVLCSIWLYKQEEGDIAQENYFALEDSLPLGTLAEVIGKIVRGVYASEKTEVHDFETDPEFNAREDLKEFLVVSLPLKSREGVIGVLNIWQKKTAKEATFSPKLLQLFSTLATNVAIAMDNKALSAKMIDSERIKKELEIASEIQTSLYKSDFRCHKGLFYTKTLPAYEVGGDYYGLMPIGEEKCFLAVADISGKGIPAALMAVNLNSIIRNYEGNYQSPEVLLSKINSVMYDDLNRSKMFFTSIMAVYDTLTRRLVYSNAGHCYPLIYDARSGKVGELILKGVMVGIAPEADYRLGQIQLDKGDVVIFYSDGVLDGVNQAGERFGKERFFKILEESAMKDGEEIASDVLNALQAFMENHPQKDDITLVVLKVKD